MPFYCKFQCVASEIVFQPSYPYTICTDCSYALAPCKNQVVQFLEPMEQSFVGAVPRLNLERMIPLFVDKQESYARTVNTSPNCRTPQEGEAHQASGPVQYRSWCRH